MDLVITRTVPEEAERILEIQREAFKEELELYQDFKTNPATESILKLLYKINKNLHYSIFLEHRMIGAAELRLDSETECYINRIFLVPEFQNQGWGTKIIEYFEEQFPHVTKWTLCTPHKSYRNHHFYEKLGYKKVGEHQGKEGPTLYSFLKERNDKANKYEEVK